MLKKSLRDSKQFRRKRRVRRKIHGTAERPRLSVFRSSEHIYAQLIDDDQGHTLVSASTLDKEVREQLGELAKKESAREVGKALANRAKEKGFNKVVFDRNGYLYHGRVAEVATGAREAGLDF